MLAERYGAVTTAWSRITVANTRWGRRLLVLRCALTYVDIRRLSEVTRELPRVVRTENGDLVSVVSSEFAEPGLSAQTEVAVHLRAGWTRSSRGCGCGSASNSRW